MQNNLLEMQNVKKSFGATTALKGVDFDLRQSEVHMLLGENGAGKSTLMRILAGSLRCDAGEILLDGTIVEIKTPAKADSLGIGMVYQELALVEQMSVLENVLINRFPRRKRLPFVNWKIAKQQAKEVLEKVGLGKIELKQRLSSLSLGVRQLIEIAKAISKDAKLIILDEPTSALNDTETKKLFEVIIGLKAHGVSFIFITHKLEEVFIIGDRVTVFRDGEKIEDTVSTTDIEEDELIRRMVGRKIEDLYPKENNVISDEVLLEVRGLSDKKHFKNINFVLKKGEIVGMAGLIGSGRSEIAEAIFGLRKSLSGEIIYKGSKHIPKSPKHSLSNAIGFTTKNRKSGLLLHFPIYRNVTLSNAVKFVKFKIFRRRKLEIKIANEYVNKLSIKTPNVKYPTSSLSGGNQQKVVISKLLCADCDVYLMDDPTRGVDVGAKVEIYKLMNELTRKGCGILFISSEMPELLGMANRILVARQGELVADLGIEQYSQEIIMKKIAGGTENE